MRRYDEEITNGTFSTYADLFTLFLLYLSSFFYLGILQTNKEVTFAYPTKQQLAKIQITFGCFLFIGTFKFNNNINQVREGLLAENPRAYETYTIEDITQEMVAHAYYTNVSFTKHILSAISTLLFSISILLIIQGFYNLNKEK